VNEQPHKLSQFFVYPIINPKALMNVQCIQNYGKGQQKKLDKKPQPILP
jgi:hypothetical protein